MSLLIDRKYLSLLSSRLSKFVVKGNGLYNFRCPLCGDSQKHKNKARGYCYPQKNNLFFKCHNCDASTTFPKFLEQIDSNLYKEYIMERFKDGETGKANYQKPEFTKFKVKNRIKDHVTLEGLPSLSSLPDDHSAKKYIKGRLIPSKYLDKMFYCDDFKGLIDKLVKNHEHKLIERDKRIVIPFYDTEGELIALQGRSINENESLRYITIKIQKDSPKIFGLDEVNMEKRFYVLEGPIDAMCLPNAIAAAGSDFPKDLNKHNAVIVFDNEPRKRQTVKKVKKAIDNGYKVCLWPPMQSKDVNDLIKIGIDAKAIIDGHTYQGLEAQVKFSQWSKI
jgi:hypothetical protein